MSAKIFLLFWYPLPYWGTLPSAVVVMLCEEGECPLCEELTLEISDLQQQDAKPGPVKMYGEPPARAQWHAIGEPLQRGLRQNRKRCCIDLPLRTTLCLDHTAPKHNGPNYS